MKLIGSTTSPYVRKVRLLLEGQDYEFETLQALSPEGAKRLEEYGAVKRIPILIDGDKTIFDSTIISEYLLEKKSITLSLDEKLGLKLIDELCDSGVILFQQKHWDIDPYWENDFSKRVHARAKSILDKLDDMAKTNTFTELQKDWLYCALFWFELRGILNFDGRTYLEHLFNDLKQVEKYQTTLPE